MPYLFGSYQKAEINHSLKKTFRHSTALNIIRALMCLSQYVINCSANIRKSMIIEGCWLGFGQAKSCCSFSGLPGKIPTGKRRSKILQADI